MNEFETIFVITPDLSEIQIENYFRLIIGIISAALAIISFFLYITRMGATKRIPKLYTVAFLSIWSVFWLSFTIPTLSSANMEKNKLLTAYQSKDYEVAEGIVKVLRTQPKSGHAPGDLVSVGGTEFELNYFISTHSYHLTLAHGGHLKEAVYAKIFHRQGDILRIDLKLDNG